jgi:predicted RND superfamily exporter protein
MQMSKKLLKYQKYFNLTKILHFYLKIAIIRRINVIVSRVELKKIIRLTKKIESISNHIKKIKKSNSFENVKQYRFQFYSRIDQFDFDASQSAIQNNDRDDDRDKKNYKERDKENCDDKFDNDTNRFQMMCWNREKRDYYNNDCKKIFQND